MKRAVIQSLKFTAFLLLGLLLLYVAFRNINLKELRTGLADADYRWIVLSFVVSTAAFISRARRWALLINPLGYRPGQWNVFHALMSGYLANMALPRMGEITRCVLLNRRERIPVDKLVGTVIVERVIDFISLLLIMVVLLIASFNSAGPFLRENVLFPLAALLSKLPGTSWLIRSLTITAFFTLLILLYKFRKKIFGKSYYEKIRNFIKGMVHGLYSIRHLERRWEFLFHTLFIWLSYIIMTWVVAFVLPATSHLTFGDAIFLLVIGGLGMSAPVQSGLGAFHWIISRGLHLVYDISLADGLAYALVSHTSQMVLIAVIGLVSLIILITRKKPFIQL